MRRTNRIIPTYTGDVSGACSALFELGGMVVIHDPSGCNSTYNTHDETRWYDVDSLIYITGLTERDAILGNDDKLVRDVVEAARELGPRFVALCNSPIPFISGTDFRALCKLIEREAGVPCFYVRTNGMHDYVVGAGNAFCALAERLVEARPKRAGMINILGATPLDLGRAGSDATLRTWANAAGFGVVSCWAMGSTADELARAAEAEVNLVISATGLTLARQLRERFGTPYVVGLPLGAGAGGTGAKGGAWGKRLAVALRVAAKTGVCSWPCLRRGSDLAQGAKTDGSAPLCLVGEPVLMGSIAAALVGERDRAVQVLCPLEAEGELLAEGDLRVEGEEGLECAFAQALSAQGSLDIVADPLYQPILPEGARLLRVPTPIGPAPLAHQAFSGRNGWKSAVDPVLLDPRDLQENTNLSPVLPC